MDCWHEHWITTAFTVSEGVVTVVWSMSTSQGRASALANMQGPTSGSVHQQTAKIAKLEEGNQQVKDQVCNLQVQMEARKNHQSNSD